MELPLANDHQQDSLDLSKALEEATQGLAEQQPKASLV